jgi:hypothetical protein
MRGFRARGAVLACIAAASCALVLSFAALFAHAGEPRVGYRIICHPGNPIEIVDRHFLEDAFLKKTATWPDLGVLRPFDLVADSPVRRRFSEAVLRRPVEAVRSYWQQRIFSGREVPPPEFDSDNAVVRAVLRDRGAVAYVSDEAALSGAKVLTVR